MIMNRRLVNIARTEARVDETNQSVETRKIGRTCSTCNRTFQELPYIAFEVGEGSADKGVGDCLIPSGACSHSHLSTTSRESGSACVLSSPGMCVARMSKLYERQKVPIQRIRYCIRGIREYLLLSASTAALQSERHKTFFPPHIWPNVAHAYAMARSSR